MSKTKRKPTVLQALFPILSMLIILGVGIAFLSLPAEPDCFGGCSIRYTGNIPRIFI